MSVNITWLQIRFKCHSQSSPLGTDWDLGFTGLGLGLVRLDNVFMWSWLRSRRGRAIAPTILFHTGSLSSCTGKKIWKLKLPTYIYISRALASIWKSRTRALALVLFLFKKQSLSLQLLFYKQSLSSQCAKSRTRALEPILKKKHQSFSSQVVSASL